MMKPFNRKIFAATTVLTALTLGACASTKTTYEWVEVAGLNRPEPAPVVAAIPPPPPAPVIPLDSDGDGIPDSADRCAGTPSGTVVDAQGCSCIVTVHVRFAFDSAEVVPADKTQLDGLIQAVGGPQFVGGDIVGHTDNVGASDYNVRLSLRRAQSVADYLIARGARAADIHTAGKGFSEPIADNATDAGRAENRRVVLTRACGKPS
jgi:OOP family OmpA-OmpF porin